MGSGDMGGREAHSARGHEKPRGVWPEEESSWVWGAQKLGGLVCVGGGRPDGGVIRRARQDKYVQRWAADPSIDSFFWERGGWGSERRVGKIRSVGGRSEGGPEP